MIKRLLLKLKNIKISRRNAKKVLAVLSAITVFSTTYALILPAITIDKDTAIDEPGLDVYNTEGDGKLVLSDSVPGDLTDLVSRYGSCSDLSVGAALTDGVFDEGVQMEVTPISDESIINAAVDEANEQFREAEKFAPLRFRSRMKTVRFSPLMHRLTLHFPEKPFPKLPIP